MALSLAAVFAVAPGAAWADIVPTGQYGPVYPGMDPWNVGDTPLQIGIDSSGKITVTGSVINAGTVAVGLKVKGGPDQLGELVIQNAGQVNASNAAFIGGAPPT